MKEHEEVAVVSANLSNGERLVQLIAELAALHRSHKIFDYIKNEIKLPMDRRFSQLNKFIVFAFVFSDMMRRVAKHYQAHPSPFSAAIVEHAQDDMGHFRMLVDDYRQRMVVDAIELADLERVLFREEHQFMREYAYEMWAICLRIIDDPVLLIAFLEAIEGSSQAMIAGYYPALKEYEEFSGMRLAYFGDKHLAREQGHEPLLGKLPEIADEDFVKCEEIIREHFTNAWRMLDASLACTYAYEREVLEEPV